MSANLFAPQSNSKDVLVEFRAGRMNKDDNSKWVRPDKRKGLIQLRQSQDDNLIHFVWKDRSSGIAETDLIIFPEEAVFRKIEKVKKSRVFVLDWKSSDKKMFFWMQDPKEDKDDENCKKVNQYINSPPQPGSDAGLGAGLGNLNQESLMQMLSGALPQQSARLPTNVSHTTPDTQPVAQQPPQPTTVSETPPTVNREPDNTAVAKADPPENSPAIPQQQSGNVQMTDLQSILQSVIGQTHKKGPNLNKVVDPNEIIESGILDQLDVQTMLLPFLPENEQDNTANLVATIRSPQFRQAVDMFNAAIHDGQLSELMSSFGLDPSSVDPNGGTLEFLKAIMQLVKAKQSQEKEKKEDTMDTN